MTRPKSIRWLLTAMALAISLPIVLAFLVSFRSAYRERREAVENRIADTSAAMSLAVDREIGSIQFALQVLAQSPALARGDFAAFYQEALAARDLYPGANIVLADRAGQELVGTYVPFGAQLPVRKAAFPRETLFDAGQPTVSNLYTGAITGNQAISIDVPVFAGGVVKYDLGMSMSAARFSALLHELALPPGWVGSLSDRKLVILARSVDPERFIGRRAPRPEGSAGTVIREVTASDGIRYVGGFTRSERSGWSTAILAPADAVFAGLWYWVATEAAFLVVVLLVGGVAARHVATRISRSVGALVGPARALGQGEPVAIGALDIAEADAVATSLAQAADLLAQRELERAAAERQRQGAFEMLKAIFAAAPVALVVVDRQGVIAQCNPATAFSTGLGEADLVGRPLIEVAGGAEPREEVLRLFDRLRAGETFQDIRLRHIRRDGAVVDMSLSGSPMRAADGTLQGAVLVGMDITALLNAEERLRRAARMHATGQLTGGIAHDFNNLLAVVVMSLDSLMPRMTSDAAATRLVRTALDAAAKGAELTQRLLAFASRQVLSPRAVRVGRLIEEMLPLIRQTLGERIPLSIQLDPAVWPVFVDPVQLESALINLASNARDAMPRGGTLTIAAGNVVLDEAAAGELPPGDYVSIEVADTGEGMPSAVRQHIFEPFFTTKPPGKGSGLGLSMVFGFMAQSNGAITVTSAEGEGTTFRLLLPRSPAPIAEPPPAAAALDRTGSGERILVVEDNEALRSSLMCQLESLGYRAKAADDGDAAVAILEQQRFDLVLSDMIMPGRVDGLERPVS
jgi:PAS domain S-box-containing protein